MERFGSEQSRSLAAASARLHSDGAPALAREGIECAAEVPQRGSVVDRRRTNTVSSVGDRRDHRAELQPAKVGRFKKGAKAKMLALTLLKLTR